MSAPRIETVQPFHGQDAPLSDAAIGEGFPHKALTPREAYPPITVELVVEFLEAFRAYCEANPTHPYAEHPPALMIGLFKGPLVKYLVSADEVDGTIANIRRALE